MLPLLVYASDGQEHRIRDAVKILADKFHLSDEERSKLLPSGSVVFNDRVHWARKYLKEAGLLQSPRRGVLQITDRGKKVLSQLPPAIDVAFLRQFPEFLEYYLGQKSPANEAASASPEAAAETPEEQMASAYLEFRKQVESDLLARVKASSSGFFEWLVTVRLLPAMGYGGLIDDAAQVIGGPGDAGVDGVIREDRLGLDLIYIQAKRWDSGTVGRPEIQQFVGALHGKRAGKGIYFTTSTFTKEAKEYALGLVTPKVVLVDGPYLAALMYDHNVAVSIDTAYSVKRLSSDFFEEDLEQP